MPVFKVVVGMFSRFVSGLRTLGVAGLLVAGMVFCGATGVAAATLDPAVLPKVQAATFEVVIPKPVEDPLIYEKALPMELLPFQFRNDKYFSIGTAFALGDNRYVTAAHVLNIGIGSLLGVPALRDADGKVYAIDKIVKYSLQQDFVEFTLVGQPKGSALEVNTKPDLNAQVYAVGNALGTGVVIRDGLYTSDTPEEQDGRWKWMRFSAAASPGNSGGPLLDQDGKLIGVVLMKSASENLNYALRIEEVIKAPENLAVIDRRQPYQLDIFDTTQTGTFKEQFALPKSFADFSATYQKLEDAFIDTQLKALLAKDAENVFPHGPGSNRLLHSSADINAFPSLVHRADSGVWVRSEASGNKNSLPHNGYVSSTNVAHERMFHVRKPDDVPVSKFYGDPVLYGDLLLKGAPLARDVGPEKIKVLSLGKPQEDSVYVDAYKRRWQVRVWPVAYANMLMISFALPVPDGYASMVRMGAASELHANMIDMKALTDFFYVSYDGTLAQWKDYLKMKSLLPGAFADIDIDFDYGHNFRYHSQRQSFSYTPELQKIEENSELTLGFAYFEDHGKVVWDVAGVVAKANSEDVEKVRLNRHVPPSEDLDESYRNYWGKLVKREHPDDGVAYNEDDAMYIGTVGSAKEPVDASTNPAVLYTALYGVEGSRTQDAMKAKLDLLMQNLHVNEH
jgi:serine protease Do